MAKKNLSVFESGLESSTELEPLCRRLFNSKLIGYLFANCKIDQAEEAELRERQKLALELIVQLVKI